MVEARVIRESTLTTLELREFFLLVMLLVTHMKRDLNRFKKLFLKPIWVPNPQINAWIAKMRSLLKIRWFPMREMEIFLATKVCSKACYLQSFMNIIIWNSRGALKSNFQGHIRDLVQEHDPAILVVMETKLGGDRAKAITDRLPLDGAIHTDTIGYSGGLWLLWNSDIVEVELLAKTEQEIHAEVKVRTSRLTWLFLAIYASPRSEERCILWENPTKVAELHNLPWVMAGDFNEPLIDEDKFGGRNVSIN